MNPRSKCKIIIYAACNSSKLFIEQIHKEWKNIVGYHGMKLEIKKLQHNNGMRMRESDKEMDS